MRPELRKISLEKFRANMGAELKFVTESQGHLWLSYRRKPHCVVVPMRDEAVLNDIYGRPWDELMHRFHVDQDRRLRAAARAHGLLSETFEESHWTYPPVGMTDETYWARRGRG